MDLQREVSALSAEENVWVSLCKWVLCKPQLLLFFIPAAAGMDNLDMVTEKLLIELGIYGTSVLIVTEQREIPSEIIDQMITI